MGSSVNLFLFYPDRLKEFGGFVLGPFLLYHWCLVMGGCIFVSGLVLSLIRKRRFEPLYREVVHVVDYIVYIMSGLQASAAQWVCFYIAAGEFGSDSALLKTAEEMLAVFPIEPALGTLMMMLMYSVPFTRALFALQLQQRFDEDGLRLFKQPAKVAYLCGAPLFWAYAIYNLGHLGVIAPLLCADSVAVAVWAMHRQAVKDTNIRYHYPNYEYYSKKFTPVVHLLCAIATMLVTLRTLSSSDIGDLKPVVAHVNLAAGLMTVLILIEIKQRFDLGIDDAVKEVGEKVDGGQKQQGKNKKKKKKKE